jgi:hypothetical protein
VTTTRKVLPWSLDVSAYVLKVAPEIEAQLAPAESQRRQE